jgi:hypothetical protein
MGVLETLSTRCLVAEVLNSGMMAGGSPAELNILIHLLCIKSFSPRDVKL